MLLLLLLLLLLHSDLQLQESLEPDGCRFFVLHAAIYPHCYLDDGEKLLVKIEARIHLASIDLTIFATIKRIGHV